MWGVDAEGWEDLSLEEKNVKAVSDVALVSEDAF